MAQLLLLQLLRWNSYGDYPDFCCLLLPDATSGQLQDTGGLNDLNQSHLSTAWRSISSTSCGVQDVVAGHTAPTWLKVNPSNTASEAGGGVLHCVKAGQRSLQTNSPVLNIHHNHLHVPPQLSSVRMVLPSSSQLTAAGSDFMDGDTDTGNHQSVAMWTQCRL